MHEHDALMQYQVAHRVPSSGPSEYLFSTPNFSSTDVLNTQHGHVFGNLMDPPKRMGDRVGTVHASPHTLL